MKHLTRIILIAFVLVSVMPAVADSANERISQWKKDRLAEAQDTQPVGASAQGTGASDSSGSSREEGARFERDGRQFSNDRFPWAAPGLIPNNPNGTQSQATDTPDGDADGWWWAWWNNGSNCDNPPCGNAYGHEGDDEGDEDEDSSSDSSDESDDEGDEDEDEDDEEDDVSPY